MSKYYFFKIMTVAAMAFVPFAAGAQSPATSTAGPIPIKSVTKNVKNFIVKQVRQQQVRRKVTDVSAFSGRTLYGSMLNSSTWADASIGSVPYGIYSFEMGDAPSPKAHLTHLYYSFISGANSRGKFYGITALSVMGAFNGSRYITLDTKQWKEIYSRIHTTDEGSYSLLASVMAYNPIDNQIYAFQYNDDLSGLYWSKYNKETQALEQIASFRGQYNVLTLASDPSGVLYIINDAGDLYTINKVTGRATLKGNTGITPTLYSQAMTYDGKTGTFLWASQTADGSILYSVDPATAETKEILKFQNNEQFSSLYSEDNEAVSDAPASVKDLKLTYDGDGALTGNITFTAPTTTYGGSNFSSGTLNVWLDGVNQKGVEVNAGDKITMPVSLTDGNHYIAVNMQNESGYSPLASVYQYAGYDTPVKVSKVTFAYDKALGKDTVTWAVPDSGVNSGYIDKANLKYNIVRMPDSVTVASNYTSTKYVESVPTAMHNYSYRVYAINKDKTGAYTESNSIISGNSFTVPYSQDFSNTNTLKDFFTVVDNNKDNNTWRNGYQMVRIDLSKNTGNGDDWLITPPITLDKGNKYRFTVNLKTYASGYPEHFKVCIGTDPKDISTFKVVDDVDNYECYKDYTDHNSDFSIDKDGDYYVGLYYCSDTAKHSAMLLVKSVAVNKIGAVLAPEAVSDLTITPDASDALAATVSFTSPSKNLAGDQLSSMSDIKVYRNSEANAAYTFENPAVGVKLSWNDTSVPAVGTNSYTVVASNDNGEGQKKSASAFIGVYTAPYCEKFNTAASASLYTTEYKGLVLGNNYGWSYQNQSMALNAFVMGDSIANIWLFTPAIKMDAEAVYSVSCLANVSVYTNTITNKVYAGNAADSASQTMFLGDMPKSTNYKYKTLSYNLVTSNAGKYYIGINSVGRAKWDYMSMNMDSMTVTYLKSAKSPYIVTDYKSQADVTGAYKATLTFNAPKVDYRGQTLSDLSKIDIYRGESAIPIATINNPTPGEVQTWTDNQAIHGINKYMIVPSNSYGRGEAYYDTVYVGRDIPEAVGNYVLKSTSDNADAVLTWNAPTKGKNGGVVVPSELSYNIYKYDTSTQTFVTVASNITDCSFTAQHSANTTQAVYYYAVAPINTEGVGDTTIHSIVLGKLYEVPYKESFAKDSLSTSPWLIKTDNSYSLTWGVTNPDGSTYNSALAEDSDGGCAYMYNGSYSSYYGGAGFISPKMTLNGKSEILSFWVYNIKTGYTSAKKPAIVVKASVDDDDFVQLGDTIIVGGDTEDGWRHYTISLDKYKDSKYICFMFNGFTNGYSDVIYLDNIVVGNAIETSINNTEKDMMGIKNVNYYDLSGKMITNPGKGIYIKAVTFRDGTKKYVKYMNK
jgi:hypothetical protein